MPEHVNVSLISSGDCCQGCRDEEPKICQMEAKKQQQQGFKSLKWERETYIAYTIRTPRKIRAEEYGHKYAGDESLILEKYLRTFRLNEELNPVKFSNVYQPVISARGKIQFQNTSLNVMKKAHALHIFVKKHAGLTFVFKALLYRTFKTQDCSLI